LQSLKTLDTKIESKMIHKPPGPFLFDGFYYRIRFMVSLR